MKKLIIITIISAITLAGCTGDFDSMNIDPNRFDDITQREVPFMFAKAQTSSALDRTYYQTVQCLCSDFYSQYFACVTTSFTTDRYVTNPDWLGRFWLVTYVHVAPQLKSIIDLMGSDSGEGALANIVWVYAFHRLADHFGPIPYFEALEPLDSFAYDPMDEIYDNFFARLTQAVATLEALPAGTRVLQGYELMYDGDVDNWIRFANTLRLRLAMRISNVDPAKARTEAEAAVTAGVMTGNDHNAFLLKSTAGNDANGLSQVAVWNEFAMSSTIASYMKGYDDPRMEYYFQPPLSDSLLSTGGYNSLRNGHPATDLNLARNQQVHNSNVGTYWAVPASASTFAGVMTAPFHVMCCAEAYFLRAEGALNGWSMGGDARQLYEQGITLSMQQWGVLNPTDISNYIQSTFVPVEPDDFEESPPVDDDIVVAWAGDEATQRQQIGTQKWLAIFPNGMEAWAEYRRTGYPTMYPVVQSDNANLPQGMFIKRTPYPQVEIADNLTQLERGRTLLNGPDNEATRLWWDVD